MFLPHSYTKHSIVSYALVGTLLFITAVLLGAAVWHYTYNALLQEPALVDTSVAPANSQYTNKEWDAIMHADSETSSAAYSDEEWEAVTTTDTASTTEASYTPEEWDAIMNSN